MNLMKKSVMLTSVLALMASNTWSMKDYITEERTMTALDIVDTLVQAASIEKSDSTNEGFINKLAVARKLVNAGYIVERVYKVAQDLNGQLAKKDFIRVASAYFRGRNISKDYAIANNNGTLAQENVTKVSTKNVMNKKICQYVWLLCNKGLPYLGKYADSLGFLAGDSAKVVLEASELYRQHFMYRMVGNRKKSA